MHEYIERKSAIREIRKLCRQCDAKYEDRICMACRVHDASKIVDEFPASDVAPVVHAKWILGHIEPGYFTPGGNRPWICSECGYLASWMLDSPNYNYYPNCGKKMDGGEMNETKEY